VFLLRKRYTRPEDLPGATLEECALSAAQVARLLQPFGAGIGQVTIGRHPLMRSFLASLSPEQWAAMGSAAAGLSGGGAACAHTAPLPAPAKANTSPARVMTEERTVFAPITNVVKDPKAAGIQER
jgi:hypothetical protein